MRASPRLPCCRNGAARPGRLPEIPPSLLPSLPWHAGCIVSPHEGGRRMKRLTEEMDEKLPGLFEPHIVLPVQYFTRLQRSAVWTGEQRLMAAVLEDAIAVCSKRGIPKRSKGRQILRETLRWLRSNDRKWTFSFLRICEHL